VYQDFLQLFRNQTNALVNEIVDMETSGDGDDSSSARSELVGLDAKIPGGKFDSAISDTARRCLENGIVCWQGLQCPPIRK
jgi:hypothetical protein